MKKESFAPIPNSILRRADLSPGAKLCYARLLQYQGSGEAAYPSNASLAEELAVTSRQIQKYLRKLEEIKLIKVTRIPGNRSSYTLGNRLINDNSGMNDSSPLNDSSATHEQKFVPPMNDSSGATKEKIEKNNKRKKYTGKALNEKFLKFWDTYPKRNGKKLGKAKTEKLFNGLSVSDQEQILTAVKHYAASGQMAKDPERFIKNDYWRDWIEPAETGQPTTETEPIKEYGGIYAN